MEIGEFVNCLKFLINLINVILFQRKLHPYGEYQIADAKAKYELVNETERIFIPNPIQQDITLEVRETFEKDECK